VSITVVDQQIDDALTVPIAAVKQDGTGRDVVRTVSLARGGRVIEVPVTTGLTEGSYIQVTGGLRLGQLVIVQVNQG
jgi:multidrug efflux pump subunit AcrA (membrane-fusion protein)